MLVSLPADPSTYVATTKNPDGGKLLFRVLEIWIFSIVNFILNNGSTVNSMASGSTTQLPMQSQSEGSLMLLSQWVVHSPAAHVMAVRRITVRIRRGFVTRVHAYTPQWRSGEVGPATS